MDDFEVYSNSDIAKVIDEYIHSERDRMILKMNLIDGRTYQEISDHLISLDMDNRTKGLFTKYGLSPKQVGRVIIKQEKIVFKRLQKW